MIETIVLYTFLVLTLDAITCVLGNKKYRGYIGMEEYFRLLTHPMYLKNLMIKIFIVNFLIILFSILF